MKNRILITGGCGFIGTSLISAINSNTPQAFIVVLDDFSAGTANDLSEVTQFSLAKPDNLSGNTGVVLVEGNICDAKTTLEVTRDVDTIIHLAANTGVAPSVNDPRMDMESNVIGTFNLLEAARINQANKLVFASSGAPAGTVSPPIHEELPPHPVSPYGASKLAGEGYCSAYSNSFGISTVCLRFGNVYGPRSKNKTSVVAKFIRQAIEGIPCEIYGDGNQTRDFIYIDDLINAILLSMEKHLRCETFQIAGGKEMTILEVSNLISGLLKKKGVNMEIKFDSPRVGDVMRNFSDIRKAQSLLGWQYKTDITDGLEKTIEYFLNR